MWRELRSSNLLFCYLFTFCFVVVVEVEGLVEVGVEIAVVMEECVVHRRGPLILCPFGGEECCCVDDPFGLDLHQHHPPDNLFLQDGPSSMELTAPTAPPHLPILTTTVTTTWDSHPSALMLPRSHGHRPNWMRRP
jgi:hypothetical protein